MDAALEQQYYMKGKSKHLFWPMLIYLVLSPFMPIVLSMIFEFDNPAYLSCQSIIMDLFGCTLLLMFGMKSNIKEFRMIFFVLSGCALFGVLCTALNIVDNRIFSIEFSGELEDGGGSSQVPSILFISPLITCCCMIFILMNRQTGSVLKCAAALYMFSALFCLACTIFFVFPIRDNAKSGSVLEMLAYLYFFIRISPAVFFYAAICFTKTKPRKPPAAPAEATTII